MVVGFIQNFIKIFFDILSFLIVARALLSWFPGDSAPKLRTFLHDSTEPVLSFFRKIIPRVGMLDISPIIAIFALDLVKSLLLLLLSKIPL